MKKTVLFTFAILVLVVCSAFAGELVVTTGGSKGTYKAFYDQISKVCSAPALTEMPSSGSVKNLENLLDNKANIGFVQEDVLFASKIIDNNPDIDTIKVLMTLYPEEVHILALNTSVIRKFSDLGNKRVASFGGGYVTSEVLFGRTGVRHSGPIYQARDENEARAWLDQGRVDAIIAVGGQPLDWVKALPSKYHLVEFNMFDKVNDIYQMTTLNDYSNLRQSGVKTIATHSNLVTVNYETAGKVADLMELKGCINANLGVLKETTGNHKKWRQVRKGEASKWPMYGKSYHATTKRHKK